MKIKPPLKQKNKDRRTREYLTEAEVDKVIKAARINGRHANRDATMILVSFRHGLRVSELVGLKWEQVNFNDGLLTVNRLKNGIDGTHPLFGSELRCLKKVKRDYKKTQYVFISERGTPITTSTFRKILARAGVEAGIEFPIHPHMLRHSTGFKLANSKEDTRCIQQYLGHKNITHTSRYTEMSATRFNNFWQD